MLKQKNSSDDILLTSIRYFRIIFLSLKNILEVYIWKFKLKIPTSMVVCYS